MKKSIISAIIGVVVTGAAYGQGHIAIGNYYTAPFNQIVWSANPAAAPAGQANQAVKDFGLQFQLFYGEGVLSDLSQLSAGVTFGLYDNPDFTGYDPGSGHGAGGYFNLVTQVLPGWSPGETYTFMYQVITPGYTGSSALWTESAQIVSTEGSPLFASTVPGLTVSVPEPSSLALAGIGSAALLLLRRRK